MAFTSTQFLASLTAISLTVGIYRSEFFQNSLQSYKSEKIELVNPYEQKLEGVKKLKGDQLRDEEVRLEKIKKINDFGEFGVREDQNCNAAPKFFSKAQPRTAISSFPGSGNTWARHLLHMASGYWTGNRRGSNHLKQYGWQGEDRNCRDGSTIAQKTHRLSKNKACKFERGLVIVRNPFEAILAAFNHHKAGKTGEPPYSVFKTKEWKDFVKQWIKRWTQFHREWAEFDGPKFISCFEDIKDNTKSEVGKWLEFLGFDDRRLGCVDFDPVGQFYRHKTKDYSHIFDPFQKIDIMREIHFVSELSKKYFGKDCTKLFRYDKCCNNGTFPYQ